MKLRILASLALVCMTMTTAVLAGAPNPTRYILEWSDPTTGASASGFIELDRNLIVNPGFNVWTLPDPTVLDFEITVTGSAGGNGTWTLADYGEIILDTNGALLDFDTELVGQPTSTDPWGTPSGGNGGDFNIFTGGGNRQFEGYDNVAAPQGVAPPPFGTWYFEITVGSGEALSLTSFRPAGIPEAIAVPTLSAIGLALMLGALLSVGLLAMGRRSA